MPINTMTDNYEIVTAHLCHSEQIYNIELTCFPNDPWSKNSITETLENNTAVCFAASLGQQLIGFISLYVYDIEAEIVNIAVLPEYRKKGIASSLMRHAIKYATSNKIEKLMLEVRESNSPAIALYESFGFYKVGLRKNYYTNPKENALLMDLILKK